MNYTSKLLHNFSNSDWKNFYTFSKSRFSKESDLYRIFTYLSKHRKQFDFQKIDNRYLNKKLRPDLHSKSFDNILSRLCSHIEAYFIWAEASEVENKNKLLISALKRRNLFDQFEKKTVHYIDQQKVNVAQAHDTTLNLHKTLHDQYFTNVEGKNLKPKKVLENCISNFMTYTSRTTLTYLLELNSRDYIKNDTEWQEIKVKLENFPISEDSFTSLFKNLISLQKEQNDELFDRTYHLLSQIQLNDETREFVIVHLTNYLWKQTREGNYSRAKKLMDLYQMDLDVKLKDPDAVIPIGRFHNIVDSGCGFNEFKKTKEFVENNHTKVKKALVIKAKVLAECQIAFAERDFNKVANILSQNRFKDLNQELRAQSLLLRSHYEVDGNNPAFMKGRIKSFLRFLDRNKSKVGKTITIGLRTLAIYIEKMSNNENPNDLLKAIQNEEYLIFRNWLEAKLKKEGLIN
jgi:hypothetical protein